MTNRERLDIRRVSLDTVDGDPVDLVVADLSFISATRAVPVLVGDVAKPGSPLVVLVKPQFEAGRVEASRGRGVIRDPDVHRRTLGEVATALVDAGAVIMGAMPSPITGHSGNVEFLLYARTPGGGRSRVSPTWTPSSTGPSPKPIPGRRRAEPVARIAFALHPDRSEATALADRAVTWLGERGHEAVRAGSPGGRLDLDGVDLLVSLGGDGTLLRAVDSAPWRRAPR